VSNESNPLLPSTPEATAAVSQSRGATASQEGESAGREAGFGFRLGDGVRRASEVRPHERGKSDPIYRPLRIYALDAAASRLDGAIALVNVPYEPLEPGPVGALFEVDCRDAVQGCEYRPVDLDSPPVLIRDGRSPSPSDPCFHQQMVYAVASTVHAAFKRALGRDLAWGFDGPKDGGPSRLRLRPFACDDRNAWYSKEDGEVCFGYFQSRSEDVHGRNLPDGFVFTSLSHDVVAHEVTHALLDGLRAHFTIPSGPDVLAFHEAFADLVALFQRFSYKEVVLAALTRTRARMDQADLLTGLARQFGDTTGSRGPLRDAFDETPDGRLRRYDPTLECHALGGVLVAAVWDAFRNVFQRKTERYIRIATRGSSVLAEEELSADLKKVLADQAAKLAQQFLSICIRAIDYCPPVDLELGEFLRAVITADHDLVPDDPWAYREAWIDAFARRGIFPRGVRTLSEDSLRWQPPDVPLGKVPGLSFEELHFAGDPGRPAGREEIERQARKLGAFVAHPDRLQSFGLLAPGDGAEPPCVESIRSLRRVGPDGQVVFDLVAEVTQRRTVRDPALGELDFFGGSTVILGPDGEVRYLLRKRADHPERYERQRTFMAGVGRGYWRKGPKGLLPEERLFRLVHSG
jgi:hypothetical protein